MRIQIFGFRRRRVAAELLAGSGEPGGIRLRFAPPHPHAFGHGRSVEESPSFLKIMESIRAADSAESVDAQRELYAKVVTQLGQFMPAVPLLNVTSKVAVSRSVQGYQTEQNAIEFFSKLRLS